MAQVTALLPPMCGDLNRVPRIQFQPGVVLAIGRHLGSESADEDLSLFHLFLLILSLCFSNKNKWIKYLLQIN